MVTPDLTGLGIDVTTARGKDPLPAELFAPRQGFRFERAGKLDAPVAGA